MNREIDDEWIWVDGHEEWEGGEIENRSLQEENKKEKMREKNLWRVFSFFIFKWDKYRLRKEFFFLLSFSFYALLDFLLAGFYLRSTNSSCFCHPSLMHCDTNSSVKNDNWNWCLFKLRKTKNNDVFLFFRRTRFEFQSIACSFWFCLTDSIMWRHELLTCLLICRFIFLVRLAE